MKKILKITLYSILIVLLAVLVGIHILYYTFSPGDKGVTVIELNLIYFQESYDDCRQSLLAEARKITANNDQSKLFSIRVLSHPVYYEPDQTDESDPKIWLFFGPFFLEVYQKDDLVSGCKILYAKSVNEICIGVRKSANPKLN